MKEYKTFKMQSYFTPGGSPTCAKDFKTAEVCFFHDSAKLGTLHLCLWHHQPLEYAAMADGNFLQPIDSCPMHEPN
jgi:hypothetical protein